jgi:hypothetical protein
MALRSTEECPGTADDVWPSRLLVLSWPTLFSGGLRFQVASSRRNEFLKYPSVYPTQEAQEGQEAMKSVMPDGMAARCSAIMVLAVIDAML